MTDDRTIHHAIRIIELAGLDRICAKVIMTENERDAWGIDEAISDSNPMEIAEIIIDVMHGAMAMVADSTECFREIAGPMAKAANMWHDDAARCLKDVRAAFAGLDGFYGLTSCERI